MVKKPTTLRTLPSKQEVYKVFNRLFLQWPEDKIRPNRSIRALKPLTPESPQFDERHYFYQSAAMKVLLSNKIRKHYKLSDEYLNPQSVPQYYTQFIKRLEKEGLPRDRGGMIRRIWHYITGKEKSIN